MSKDVRDSPRARALEIHRLLAEAYGERPHRPRLDPVSELVSTVLSQNTNDSLRDKAFARLRERFPTWEQVRDAPVEEIASTIQLSGLAYQKAKSIKEALQRISAERGKLSLDFLKEMSVEEARGWLTSFKGIGPKTAAIIMLFSLDMPAFPVDTHVHRVSQRLGLIPAGASREKAHKILEELLPPQIYYAFHLNLIAHGRQVCRAPRPRCEMCFLQEHCDYYLSNRTLMNAEKH